MPCEFMNILYRVQRDGRRQKKQREDEYGRTAHVPKTKNAEKTVSAPILRDKPEDEKQRQYD